MKNLWMGVGVLGCLAAAAFGQGKESEEELTLGARTVVQEMDRAISLSKRSAVEKLKRCLRTEMQGGHLGRANRISLEIERIQATLKEAPTGDSPTAPSFVGGAWRSAAGAEVTFKANGHVAWGEDSWEGTWCTDNGKVQVMLTKLGGKEQQNPQQFALELPAKVGNVTQMKAQPGREIFTLTRQP